MAATQDDEKSIPIPLSTMVNANDGAAMDPIEPVQTNNVRPACFNSTFQEILFVLSATMAIAMSSFLAGSVTVTSSFVGRSLHMTTAQITWIASASSLSSGAFLLFFGKLADLFGKKLIFVGSLFLFALFCLVAGFAEDAISLDTLNGVLGLFSASAVPPAIGLLGVIYEKPSKRKNAAFACFSAGNPLGFVFGTVFGGVATSLFGWRASFWLLAIIFVAFTLIALISVPKDVTKTEHFSLETVKNFDLVGTFLTVAGIGMLSAALSLGATAIQGWRTPYVLILLIIGISFIIAFIFWELWFDDPLMPMHIWKDRNFSLLMGIIVLGMIGFTPAIFFLALFFQEAWHLSALTVAVYLLPMVINGIIVNIFAAWALHRISNKLLMWIATSAYAVAALLLAVNRVHDSYWSFCFPALCLVVVGADLEFNVANMYVLSSMPPSQQSTAGAIFQTVAKLCGTIGMGFATAVFNSVGPWPMGPGPRPSPNGGPGTRPSMSHYWGRETRPFAATFWTAFAVMALSICLVPFLTIGTQGGKEKPPEILTKLQDEGTQRGEEEPPEVSTKPHKVS